MQRGVRFNCLPITQWNAAYLSADILNYFINQETNNQISLDALTKLEPKTWLSDITIDAFYYLLNKYEKVKNIPAEESAYFVDSVFMHGPHSEILYNTVNNLNLKNIEDKENISAIESTINVWFELFNKKGSKTVYNILKKTY